ncbi:MAG: methyl-accepting chemotaxis protein [Defluviitaleaceae bacterium]|nr:methyl-accepting chemotaxis protein [Defluviitaleaceae bacterium]
MSLKIGSRLLLGFGSVLVIAVAVAIIAFSSLVYVNSRYEHISDFPNQRYSMVRTFELGLMDLRRLAILVSYYEGNEAGLVFLQEYANEIHAYMNTIIDRFIESVNEDTVISEATRSEYLQQIGNLGLAINSFITDIIGVGIAAALVGDAATLSYIRVQTDILVDELYVVFEILSQNIENYLLYIVTAVETYSSNITAMIVVLLVVGAIVSVVIGIVITRSITRPMNEIVHVLEDIRAGNLNVNIRNLDRKDELGSLAKSAKGVVNVVETLVEETGDMGLAHSNGNLDVFINATKFPGSYSEMADKINVMAKSHIGTQNKILDVFSEIGKGNFDIKLEKLPGQKAQINETVESICGNIIKISDEINHIVNFILEGHLSESIDTTKFEGSWKEMMSGLNEIMHAVNEPLDEMNKVMGRLSDGEFNLKVQGDYKGDFLAMRDSVNVTIDKLSSYIQEMKKVLVDVADGDLRQRITRTYSGDFATIKTSINQISESLQKTMNEIGSSAENVLGGSQSVSQSAIGLANGATEQSTAIDGLNNTIESISNQTRQNANNAREANELSKKSTENAKSGNAAMKDMLDAMEKIKESSNSISNVVKVIDDIAFQTNLLALNASVEAARAGEHGRGFAVVAEEVRNLANRSRAAASETTTLIAESIQRVETGANMAEITSESLDTIVHNANEVLEIIHSISLASKEQEEAITHVSSGINQISQVVQSNTSVSEEAATASQQLNAQAEALRELVGYFKL